MRILIIWEVMIDIGLAIGELCTGHVLSRAGLSMMNPVDHIAALPSMITDGAVLQSTRGLEFIGIFRGEQRNIIPVERCWLPFRSSLAAIVREHPIVVWS